MFLKTKTLEKEISSNALNFFRALTGYEGSVALMSKKEEEVWSLIYTAFLTYKSGWPMYRLSDWRWPFNCLRPDSGETFEGSEPWSVCLREAVRLFKERTTKV